MSAAAPRSAAMRFEIVFFQLPRRLAYFNRDWNKSAWAAEVQKPPLPSDRDVL
jgi:hypothetical protein